MPANAGAAINHSLTRSAWAISVRLGLLIFSASMMLACALPEPPVTNLPTSPAVLDITPAPTLDIDATATVLAGQLRATPTPTGMYTVEPGDTLSTLAREFEITVEELMVANNLEDPNDLQEGQTLLIPTPQPPSTVETE
mgnify:CR=1 FL=1